MKKSNTGIRIILGQTFKLKYFAITVLSTQEN